MLFRMERDEGTATTGWFRQRYAPGNRWWFWAALISAVGAVVSSGDVAAVCATFAVICALSFVLDYGD